MVFYSVIGIRIRENNPYGSRIPIARVAKSNEKTPYYLYICLLTTNMFAFVYLKALIQLNVSHQLLSIQ